MKKKSKKDKDPLGQYTPKRQELIAKEPESLTIGQRIRRERYLRNLSLEQMANFLDISTSYLGSIERGSRRLSANMEILLHKMLGISYDFLREGYPVTGTMISQFIREPGPADLNSVRHRLDVLLNVSSDEDVAACYSMYHSYLVTCRNSFQLSSAETHLRKEKSRPYSESRASATRKVPGLQDVPDLSKAAVLQETPDFPKESASSNAPNVMESQASQDDPWPLSDLDSPTVTEATLSLSDSDSPTVTEATLSLSDSKPHKGPASEIN